MDKAKKLILRDFWHPLKHEFFWTLAC